MSIITSGPDTYAITFHDRDAHRALGEAYAIDNVPVKVEPAHLRHHYRIAFETRVQSWPKISIVIRFALLSVVLDGIVRQTDYPDCEIIIPGNGSKDPQVLTLYEEMRRSQFAIRAEIVEEPFNFARQVNRGMNMASGDHVLLLHNDIELREPDWLKEMVSCLAYPNTGIVGARLLYPNGSLQHAGVIIGLGSVRALVLRRTGVQRGGVLLFLEDNGSPTPICRGSRRKSTLHGVA
jgi:cellulose synthase/poly-beta-1,6-N-acetylglucosamine synthase-like glycosyltransferase